MTPYKVVIIDALELRYVRRKRGICGGCIETEYELGFSLEDQIRYNKATCKLYQSVPWRGDEWRSIEYVLAGDGDWKIPSPAHPDCVVIREPSNGEIFDSDRDLLWLSPSHIIELEGTLAARFFEDTHHKVIGDPEEALRHYVFEEALAILTGEYGFELEGQLGRTLIEVLTKEVTGKSLLQTDEEVIGTVAAETSKKTIELIDNI